MSSVTQFASASSQVAGDGFYSWASIDQIFAEDAVSAFATAPGGGGGLSWLLKATSFGFAIPQGASIVGIKVEFKKSKSGDSVVDNNIKLIKGGTVQGDNKGDAVTEWPLSLAWVAHGTGETDLWGLSWTSDDINASNFGVSIDIVETANDVAYIDAVRITVYYVDFVPRSISY